MDISHGKLGKIKGTELTFKNLACVHTVVSLSPNIYGGGFNLVRDFQHFGIRPAKAQTCLHIHAD